jgi:hypothetical protein
LVNVVFGGLASDTNEPGHSLVNVLLSLHGFYLAFQFVEVVAQTSPFYDFVTQHGTVGD